MVDPSGLGATRTLFTDYGLGALNQLGRRNRLGGEYLCKHTR